MSEKISPDTYAAIDQSISIARSAGHDWPSMTDIDAACHRLGVEFEPVAAAFGYLPSLDDDETRRRRLPYQRSYWINVREVYHDDDRIGVLTSVEAVHAFSAFLGVTGIQPQPIVLMKRPNDSVPGPTGSNTARATNIA